MRKQTTQKRRWRVGELAAAAGLTVRTLHHYERVGLLAAGTRTEGRQRLYAERDVRRLYRIRALRDLGLPLAEIARVVEDERAPLANLLRAHRASVDRRIAELRRLRTLLDHACAHASSEPMAEEVLATIEAMSRVVRHGEQRKAHGKKAEAAWRKLGVELLLCMKAGEPPTSPRARAVARAAWERIDEFTGGDPVMAEALARLRKLAPPENFAGWTPPMMRYLDQALAGLSTKEKKA
jgi:DNA-binding transcriptional MerR regulator